MNRCDYCRYKNSWDCEDGWDRVRNDKLCNNFVLEFNLLSKKEQEQIQKMLMQQNLEGVISMTGLEELKTAYEHISNDFGFLISDVLSFDIGDDKKCELVFKCFVVGIDMSFAYEFIVGNDPFADDIFFNGDPCIHFSIAGYRAITDFIETLQKYRSDKKVMEEFINYLKEQRDTYNYDNKE